MTDPRRRAGGKLARQLDRRGLHALWLVSSKGAYRGLFEDLADPGRRRNRTFEDVLRASSSIRADRENVLG